MSPIYEADVGRMIPSVNTLDLEGRKSFPIITEMSLTLTGKYGPDALLQRVSHMVREIDTNERVWLREDTLAKEYGGAPAKQYELSRAENTNA
jgi:hypothetical protein